MWEMNLLTTLAVTGRYKTSKFDFFSEINSRLGVRECT
jgi:hypothetical protein